MKFEDNKEEIPIDAIVSRAGTIAYNSPLPFRAPNELNFVTSSQRMRTRQCWMQTTFRPSGKFAFIQISGNKNINKTTE